MVGVMSAQAYWGNLVFVTPSPPRTVSSSCWRRGRTVLFRSVLVVDSFAGFLGRFIAPPPRGGEGRERSRSARPEVKA
jgi:hypothetical protein